MNRFRTTSWTARSACLCSRSKAPHVALALPRELVGDFGPVVGVTRGVIHDRRHDDSVRGAVAPKPIGDEAACDAAGPLEQESKEPGGCVAVPAGLEQDVDHIAVLVDRTPEVLALPANGHEEFVQVASVSHGPARWRRRRA